MTRPVPRVFFRPRSGAVKRSCRPAVEALEPRLTPSFTLAAQQTFATGTLPTDIATADFNTDGRPDLATANQSDKTVSVYLDTTSPGSATITLTAQQTFATGNGPRALAAADFNGDGRPDLAVVNNGDSTVSVLLNTTAQGAGSAAFAAQQTFATGTASFVITAADFNGDGRPDLAVASFSGKTVSVLLNTTAPGSGTASFAAQKTFAIGSGASGMAAADLNGDGRPDLIVTNNNDKTLSVLLNGAAPGAIAASFSAQQTLATGNDPYAIATADLNGDGRPDLSVSNNHDNTVSVYLNTTAAGSAAAAFAAQQTFATGTGPVGLTAADLDGDGRPDLATADETATGTVSVLLSTTDPGAMTASFAAPQTFAAGASPIEEVAADFNADGRPDLANANFTDKTLSVLRNTTAPFTRSVPVLAAQLGAQGVWEYNRTQGAFVQLTGANASKMAADPLGDIAAEFPGNGVWLFRPIGGWKQINGIDATLLDMDNDGDVVAQFPGFGVGEYSPAAGWRSLTGANASLLAVDALGDVVGEFPGAGVWLFRPSGGWTQINGVDASVLAIDPLGNVVANFHGVGVAEFYLAGGWQVLNGVEAKSLAVDQYGDVTAEFAGFGVGEFYQTRGWRSLTGANAALLAYDGLGDVIGAFAGAGVWEFDAFRGWSQLTATDATVLATG